jgi:hypothetical protein
MFTPPFNKEQAMSEEQQAEVIIVAVGTHADSPVDDDVDQYDDSEEGVDKDGVPVTSVNGSEKDTT